MKKTIKIISIFTIIALFILTITSNAAALGGIDVQTDKTTVRPGEEVKITINFGESLGAYTFDIAYDNNIFSYVSAEGGTANDTTDKVRVVFHDSSGGTNARNNMSVIFKAKEDITTSNPTELSVTAEGLANGDASVTYDDITTPIVKNLTVEPQYEDYTFNLSNTENLVINKENEMTLSYSSPMGRYYEHARLIAEATTPQDGTVQILATDSSSLEHDIIQSGWGDAQGYKIGGKDVLQELQVRGLFSKAGDYKITFKLIDRDNSDTVIAEKTFNLTAVEQTTGQNPTPENPGETTPDVTPEDTPNNEEEGTINKEDQTNNTQEMPTQLPKTGTNSYLPVIALLTTLTATIIYINRKK